MNDEKWLDIIDLIDQKFEVIDKTRQDNPIGDDLDPEKTTETVESVIFNGPLGKMKVERTIRPVIIDKKSHYSKRMGDRARVEYEFSETEKTYKFLVYKWDEIKNDWQEMDSSGLGL